MTDQEVIQAFHIMWDNCNKGKKNMFFLIRTSNLAGNSTEKTLSIQKH